MCGPFSAPQKVSAAALTCIASVAQWDRPSSAAKRREPTPAYDDTEPLAQNTTKYHDDNSFYGSSCCRKTQMWSSNLTALYNNVGYFAEAWESSWENGARENTIAHQKMEGGHTLRRPFANWEDNSREEAFLKPHALKKWNEKEVIKGRVTRGEMQIQSPGLSLEMPGKRAGRHKSQSTFVFWSHDKIHVVFSNVTPGQLGLVFTKFVPYVSTYRCRKGWPKLTVRLLVSRKATKTWHYTSGYSTTRTLLTTFWPLHFISGQSYIIPYTTEEPGKGI